MFIDHRMFILNDTYLNKITLQGFPHVFYHYCDAFRNRQHVVYPLFFWKDVTVLGSENSTDHYVVRFVCQLDICIYSQRIYNKMHEILPTFR